MKVQTLLSAVLTLGLAAGMTTGALAQEKKLAVGAQAPGLDIELWTRGDQTSIESGKVYVIDFWATWCGPCKRSIPHLTELQKEYGDKGLTIIGISNEETDLVKKFTQQWSGKMEYTVAVDRRQGTTRAWMQAAGRDTIPTAFIVDRKGKVAFIGNPLPEAGDGFDEVLKRVMSGRYDPKLEQQAAPGVKGAANARKVQNWRMANKYYDDVIKLDPAVFATVALDKFEMHLLDMDDKEAAYEYARVLMDETFANDAGALTMLSDKITSDPKISREKRDLDIALEAAQASQRLENGTPESLAAVARVRYARGEVAQAIDLQKEAYFKAAPKAKPVFKRDLEIYQQNAERQANLKKAN